MTGTVRDEQHGPVDMDEHECLALLDRPGPGSGRISVTIGALPEIVPVAYGLVDGDVVFFADDAPGVTGALSCTVVAFETNWRDRAPTGAERWDVHVVGTARLVTDAARIEAARARGLGRDQRDGAHLVAVTPGRVTGRRL